MTKLNHLDPLAAEHMTTIIERRFYRYNDEHGYRVPRDAQIVFDVGDVVIRSRWIYCGMTSKEYTMVYVPVKPNAELGRHVGQQMAKDLLLAIKKDAK
jgi:hypothetical protein